MDPRLTLIDETGEFLREKAAGSKPEIGIVLGSGLGKFGDSIEAIETIPYADIPNFAHSTAPCRAVSISMRAIRWSR